MPGGSWRPLSGPGPPSAPNTARSGSFFPAWPRASRPSAEPRGRKDSGRLRGARRLARSPALVAGHRHPLVDLSGRLHRSSRPVRSGRHSGRRDLLSADGLSGGVRAGPVSCSAWGTGLVSASPRRRFPGRLRVHVLRLHLGAGARDLRALWLAGGPGIGGGRWHRRVLAARAPLEAVASLARLDGDRAGRGGASRPRAWWRSTACSLSGTRVTWPQDWLVARGPPGRPDRGNLRAGPRRRSQHRRCVQAGAPGESLATDAQSCWRPPARRLRPPVSSSGR